MTLAEKAEVNEFPSIAITIGALNNRSPIIRYFPVLLMDLL